MMSQGSYKRRSLVQRRVRSLVAQAVINASRMNGRRHEALEKKTFSATAQMCPCHFHESQIRKGESVDEVT